MYLSEKKEKIYVIGVKDKGYIDQEGYLIQDVFNAKSYLDLDSAREKAVLFAELGDLYIRILIVDNAGVANLK
ncbi:hypothetical protein [Paenibacillus sp. XY044]|uniref:hypothetical protein n=1 Tax=Paenibacillus sp. XY044 TaxID=2026089 RepID=UPI000B99A33B|nr:hypothetical protein [Paenibacillus sp. XY044]OZB98138.1 hypothetical protein CJP46_02920 [Paenibacillus sp. XY044]